MIKLLLGFIPWKKLLGFVPWSRAFGFLKDYGKALALAALFFAGALYVINAERNRGLVEVLESREEIHLRSLANRDAQNAALREQLAANNARWLELLQKEQDRFARARIEADRIIAERDTITAELAASRRDWQEAIANDPELATFNRLGVPGAVFVRLCRAAGDPWCQ